MKKKRKSITKIKHPRDKTEAGRASTAGLAPGCTRRGRRKLSELNTLERSRFRAPSVGSKQKAKHNQSERWYLVSWSGFIMFFLQVNEYRVMYLCLLWGV